MRGRGGHPGNFALQQKFLSVKTTFGYITSYWRGCVPAFVGHSYWELRQCTVGVLFRAGNNCLYTGPSSLASIVCSTYHIKELKRG